MIERVSSTRIDTYAENCTPVSKKEKENCTPILSYGQCEMPNGNYTPSTGREKRVRTLAS
jgi:hypothetical protein